MVIALFIPDIKTIDDFLKIMVLKNQLLKIWSAKNELVTFSGYL